MFSWFVRHSMNVVVGSVNLFQFSSNPLFFHYSTIHSGRASTKAIWSRPRRPIRNENPTKISFSPKETN